MEKNDVYIEDHTVTQTFKTSLSKFDRKEWNVIEKPCSQLKTYILNSMLKLGSEEETLVNIDKAIKPFGDRIYLDIRPKLIEKNYIDEDIPKDVLPKESEKQIKKKGPKNKKNVNKLTKEDIIYQNTMKNVSTALESTLKTFGSDYLNSTFGFNSRYIEIRLITLIYVANYFLRNSKKIKEEKFYDLISGINKTVKNISQHKDISQVCVYDLQQTQKKLTEKCSFDYYKLFTTYPKYSNITSYDKILPNMVIKPYPSQRDIVNEVKKNQSGLFFYSSMIGGGKTTSVIAMASYVRKLRETNKQYKDLQIIFTCSVEPVRYDVCHLAYNVHIPFGIGVNGEDRIINNYKCKSDGDRILIVSDIEKTIELLSKSQNYILFVDEPTVGADQPDNPTTRSIMNIIYLAPPKTILCSATLPQPKDIPNIVKYFTDKHKCPVIQVCSKDSMIGCEMIDNNGSILTPHNNCKTVDELSQIVENLKTKSFIDRLYTAPIIFKLYKQLTDNGIDDIPKLETYFDKTTNLTQKSIQNVAIQLLEHVVSKNDDKLVENICVPMDKFEDCLPYTIEHIFTKEAHKYMGGCLVVVDNPVKFAYEKSKKLLENAPSASSIIGEYQTELNNFNLALNKLNSIKDEDEKNQREQEVSDSFKPSIQFPENLKINTSKHYKHFVPESERTDIELIQNLFDLDTVPMDLNVPDWIILLLFAGVGIYSPNNKLLHKRYHDHILKMASDGELAFLISDVSISYGANYPFTHVVIDDNISKNHSIGTLFQLAGRSGRVGISWVAYVHIDQLTNRKIMNFIRGNEEIGTTEEGATMSKEFNKIVKSENTDDRPIIKLSEVKNHQQTNTSSSSIKTTNIKNTLYNGTKNVSNNVSNNVIKQHSYPSTGKQDRSQNKYQNRSDRPYNRSSDRSYNISYNRSSDRPFDRSSNRSDDRSSNRSSDRPSDRPFDRSFNRLDDRSSDRDNKWKNKEREYHYNRSDNFSKGKINSNNSSNMFSVLVNKPGRYIPPHMREHQQ